LPRDFSCLFKQDLEILVTANPKYLQIP
jgi:hypothetical protein